MFWSGVGCLCVPDLIASCARRCQEARASAPQWRRGCDFAGSRGPAVTWSDTNLIYAAALKAGVRREVVQEKMQEAALERSAN